MRSAALISLMRISSATACDPFALVTHTWTPLLLPFRDMAVAAKAIGLPPGHPAHVLAALAVRALGPPQPPGTPGSQVDAGSKTAHMGLLGQPLLFSS